MWSVKTYAHVDFVLFVRVQGHLGGGGGVGSGGGESEAFGGSSGGLSEQIPSLQVAPFLCVSSSFLCWTSGVCAAFQRLRYRGRWGGKVGRHESWRGASDGVEAGVVGVVVVVGAVCGQMANPRVGAGRSKGARGRGDEVEV